MCLEATAITQACVIAVASRHTSSGPAFDDFIPHSSSSDTLVVLVTYLIAATLEFWHFVC